MIYELEGNDVISAVQNSRFFPPKGLHVKMKDVDRVLIGLACRT